MKVDDLVNEVVVDYPVTPGEVARNAVGGFVWGFLYSLPVWVILGVLLWVASA